MGEKDKLLWFCRSGDSSSLSRITDSVLPILKNNFDITLISNGSKISGINNIIMGSDCSTITYNEFISANMIDNNRRVANMKYILVQITDAISTGDYKYLMLCNGVYEIDWFVKILKKNPSFLTNKDGKETKLVVWSPIDYLPCYKVIENVIKADLFITMTPIMADKIRELSSDAKVEWVGHGSDINGGILGGKIEGGKINAIKELNKIIISNSPLNIDDIIILNANNYGPLDKNDKTIGTRKRLDITVNAFIKLLQRLDGELVKKTKLWIHTNIKSFFMMIKIYDIDITNILNNLILTNNNVTNEQLCMIYSISTISLQTSVAEGWSLLNMESALFRSIQVVPDFLACGWHFKDGKGILIPVTKKIIKNEAGFDVIIGEVSIDDTVDKLSEAMNLLNDYAKLNEILNKAFEYANSYTWNNVSDKLALILKNLHT
jgi:hypothetical protein